MARATGLEPATSGVTGRHSNRLSYARVLRRRPAGLVSATRRGLGGAPWAVKPLNRGLRRFGEARAEARRMIQHHRCRDGAPRFRSGSFEMAEPRP